MPRISLNSHFIFTNNTKKTIEKSVNIRILFHEGRHVEYKQRHIMKVENINFNSLINDVLSSLHD